MQKILKKNEKIIGTIAAIVSIIMFVSLIEILLSNISGKSNIFIQPLATAFSGLFWSLYAYGRKDLFVLIPNVLACILGTITAISALM
jgi:hypothetical protein